MSKGRFGLSVVNEVEKENIRPHERPKQRTLSLLLATVYIWIASALTPICTSLTGLLLARLLPTAEYGKMAFFFSIVSLVNLLGSAGLTSQVRILAAQSIDATHGRPILTEIRTLFTLRIITSGFLMLVGVCAYGTGQSVVGLGFITGALSLLSDFALAIYQGIGGRVIGVSLQVLPSVLYLSAVIFLPLSNAGDTQYIVLLTYAPSLLIGTFCSRAFLRFDRHIFRMSLRTFLKIILPAGQVYLLTLASVLTTMFGSLILGSLNRFTETSAFVLSLTSSLFLPPHFH